MIPQLLLGVMCSDAEMLMSFICLNASKFNDCCFIRHSIIKLSDLNFVTFFTCPAQYCIAFFYKEWWHFFVIDFWFDVKTMNLDQFLLQILLQLYFFLFLDGVGYWDEKKGCMVQCIIVHHPCPHPPRSDTWILRISVRKHQDSKDVILEHNLFIYSNKLYFLSLFKQIIL